MSCQTIDKVDKKERVEIARRGKSAFNKLENKIINSPMLAIPYPKQKIQLETDTSGYAIGGVLSQQQENDS